MYVHQRYSLILSRDLHTTFSGALTQSPTLLLSPCKISRSVTKSPSARALPVVVFRRAWHSGFDYFHGAFGVGEIEPQPER